MPTCRECYQVTKKIDSFFCYLFLNVKSKIIDNRSIWITFFFQLFTWHVERVVRSNHKVWSNAARAHTHTILIYSRASRIRQKVFLSFNCFKLSLISNCSFYSMPTEKKFLAHSGIDEKFALFCICTHVPSESARACCAQIFPASYYSNKYLAFLSSLLCFYTNTFESENVEDFYLLFLIEIFFFSMKQCTIKS